ncbi:MAG: hypothetical protein ACRDXC_04965 [Acidimicrobiales bacterium]
MTVTTGGPDVAVVVRALSDANVQFVVVGEPSADRSLQLVVSRHPANLDALGRALDRLGSTLLPPGVKVLDAGNDDAGNDDAARRVGDPMGTISIVTSGGDVDLMFGGPRRSLYAEVALHAEVREVGGLRVQWTGGLAAAEPVPPTTSRVLGRRLLSLAEGIAHVVERRDTDRSPGGEHETGV